MSRRSEGGEIDYKHVARVLREALADMVGQHGGAETCLSANEHAADALEWTKWLDDDEPFESAPWITPEMRLRFWENMLETCTKAGGDTAWIDEMIAKERAR